MENTTVLAYHNDPKIKANILRQLRKHAKADEIIKGQYWEDGKGCAVGCTIYSGDHAEYETRFGIPQALAQLEDTIFEGLPNAEARLWPIGFMEAIKPGADLTKVVWHFLHWLLTDAEVNPGIIHPLVSSAVKQCADLLIPLTKGEPVDPKEASAAWDAANAAYYAANAASVAAYAAESAAYNAESAAYYAAYAAESAVRSAAHSAAYSAANAASAARSAAYSAAWGAARSAAYSKMAEKLLELIKAEGK